MAVEHSGTLVEEPNDLSQIVKVVGAAVSVVSYG
jgi:hypothetical protein